RSKASRRALREAEDGRASGQPRPPVCPVIVLHRSSPPGGPLRGPETGQARCHGVYSKLMCWATPAGLQPHRTRRPGGPGDLPYGASRCHRRAGCQGKDVMKANITKVAELLHEAAETHHVVYRIVDGADDDWASWYADWLVRLSELPQLLGAPMV